MPEIFRAVPYPSPLRDDAINLLRPIFRFRLTIVRMSTSSSSTRIRGSKAERLFEIRIQGPKNRKDVPQKRYSSRRKRKLFSSRGLGGMAGVDEEGADELDVEG